MSFKVRQIEAIDLADKRIQVYRELGDSSDALIIEVRDERRYLKARTHKGEEIKNLFSFLRPLVQRFLRREQEYFENVINQNQKKIEEAKRSKKEKYVEPVWDFEDRSYYRGRMNLTIEKAEAKLNEQKQKLLQIKNQLRALEKLV